ncbi:YSIRK-type signal peptide-containing protein [Streptococcus oralis]|uniref:SHIRT domain-containing protein n=1 Tax=Streptococcus oralis TaxID=1303 RepID=UPI001F2DC5F6|nr:SHIRT domain-containing protein [Streptococcus oralis]UJD00642.1 YSIRK-type signal peptide-containing protein [Streptococcus oralis]
MFFQDRKIKYSIRKLSVATVSLAIGFLFAPAALGAAQVAQADELTATEQVENKAENQVSVGSSAAERAESQKESQVALKSAAPAATETSQATDSTAFKNAQAATGASQPAAATATAQPASVNASLNKSTLENYLKNLRSKDFSSKTDDSLEILNGVMTAADGVLQTATKQEEIDKVYRNLVTFVNSGLRDKNPKFIPDQDKTPHSALYEFESATPGKTTPLTLNYLKPEDTKIYKKGDKVKAIQPTETTYVEYDGSGRWTFKGYDHDSQVIDKDDVFFTGKWEYAPTPYKATYRAVNGSPGKTPPAYVANWSPEDKRRFAEGEVVKPQEFHYVFYTSEEYPNRKGYWALTGFDAPSKVANNGDVEFVGTWKYFEDVIVSYKAMNEFDFDNFYKLPSSPKTSFYDKYNLPLPKEIKDLESKLYDYKLSLNQFDKRDEHLPKDLIDSRVALTGYDEVQNVYKPFYDAEHEGNWTHEEDAIDLTYSRELERAATYGELPKVTIPLMFKFTPVPRKPTYEFISGTAGKALPAEINNLKPVYAPSEWKYMDRKTYPKGKDIVQSVKPLNNSYYDAANGGTWNFSGYDFDKKPVSDWEHDGWNLKFTGTWTFTPGTYPGNYKFVSKDPSLSLPEEITTYIPSTGENYSNGDTVLAKAPLKTTYMDFVNKGTWKFEGYDANNKVVNQDKVLFTGTWSFTPYRDKTVSFDFVSDTPGKTIPDDLKAQIPAPITTSPDEYSDNVYNEIQYLSSYVDNENDGTWVPQQIPQRKEDVEKPADDEDSTYTVHWKFEPNRHSVYYDFYTDSKDDSGQTIYPPSTLYNLITYEREFVKGEKARVKMPSKTRFEDPDGRGTWVFDDYYEYDNTTISPRVKTVGTEDITFRGKWILVPTDQADKIYRLEYKFTNSTPAYPLPSKIRDMLPAGIDFVARADDYKDASKLDTSTVTVPTGTWTFHGFDADRYGKAIAGTQVKTITGSWSFTPNGIDYQFQSTNPDFVLPDHITKLTPKNPIDYKMGVFPTEVDAEQPSETTYVDTANKVTWTFAGYDKEKIVVAKGRQTFLGSWVPTPNPEYVFKSSDSRVPLPQSILGMLPNDESSYQVGDTIVAKQPAKESVVEEEKDYVWTFKGYDQKNATYNGKRVTFTGIWEVTPRPHHVSYNFVSVTSGVALPEFIQKKAPKDSSSYYNTQKVVPEEPTTKTYKDDVNDGTWTFDGYDAKSKIVRKADLTFTGKWKFKANKYQASYRFASVTAGKALPAAIAALTPSDSAKYVNGDSVSAQQPAQTTYTDTVNDGTWTFKGYDAASAVVNKADVEFVGKWAFVANKYQATYRFASATAGKALPAAIAALTPSDSAKYVNGDSVSAQQPAQTTYTDTVNDGTWTFKGYDATSAVVNKANVEFVGKWTFEANKYQASYRFESETAGKALPAAIAALTPSDSATYVNGASVSAQQPAEITYKDDVNDGTWTFKGYDAASAVVNKENVEFVGKWAFEANKYQATYRFESETAGKSLPAGIATLLPSDSDSYVNGASVSAQQPAEITYKDDVNDGTWTFKGYDAASAVVNKANVEFVGKWAFEANKYQASYRFESETAGKALPAGITALTPSDSATYVNGASVSAQQPAEITYKDDVNDGTWTFKGYDAASAVVNKSDVEFVGKWVFEANKYQATYRFESETAGKSLPAAIAALTPNDSATYVNGASVSAQQPAEITYKDDVNDGTWTFKGYDAASAVVNKANVEFVGKWSFEAKKYQANYRFESETAGKVLPAEISALTPSDSATYVNGDTVSAQQPSQTTYTDTVNDGTWTFKAYDAASAVVNKANVVFVGKWEFKANPTNAETYTPQVTEETIKVGQTPDLTDNVTNLSSLPAGTKVVDITPAGQIDTTKSGTYTGKVRVDYPDGSSTEVPVPVNVLPAPVTETYQVTYRFESATADNNLPAEVLSLLPQSGTYTTSSSSAIAFVPEAPMPVEVAVANGTWTFLGYQEVEEGANLTFVGKWVFEAKQDPSPQPQPVPQPVPQPAPQPNPVPPVKPGEEQGADNNQANRLQPEQPRKPEENPPAQSPAGEKAKQATLPNTGSTAPLSLTGLMTSSLLAGLAALLLGRKREDD